MCSLLMHAFTPITHTFPLLWVFSILSFFSFFWPCFLSFSLFFLYLLFTIFLFLFSSPFPLCTSMAFYTACLHKICHSAFGLLCVSFQDCPLICQLPSHHNYTVLAVPRLILDKNSFVLSLTPLDTPIWIRVRPLPHQPL